MGKSMENLCYYWDSKSFSLRYYRICIRDSRWILIAIESASYLGILIVRRRIRQLQR